MDAEGPKSDDLSVRLNWPETDRADDLAVPDTEQPATGLSNGGHAPARPDKTEKPVDPPSDARRRRAEATDEGLRRLTLTVERLESQMESIASLLRSTATALQHAAKEREQVSDGLLEGLNRFGQQVQSGLQQEMAAVAADVALVQTDIHQIGVGAEDAVAAALEDILDRFDRLEFRPPEDQGEQQAAAAERRDLLGKVDHLAEQVEALRHRLPVGGQQEPGTLDEETIAAIAYAVADAVADTVADALAGRGLPVPVAKPAPPEEPSPGRDTAPAPDADPARPLKGRAPRPLVAQPRRAPLRAKRPDLSSGPAPASVPRRGRSR
jgi:hypothetical protein